MATGKIIEKIVSSASKPGTAVVCLATMDDLNIVIGDTARLTSISGDKAIDVKVSSDDSVDTHSIRVPRGFASRDSMVYIASLEKADNKHTDKSPDKPTDSKVSGPGNINNQNEKNKPTSRMMMGRPDIRLSDVAGLEDAKREIEEKIMLPFSNKEAAKKFGIKSGGGVLLYGPPGTGKTHIARAVCGELGGGFFYITPSEILDKWVGASEGNVAELFQEARTQERSVIFFDEVESLLPKRSDNSSDVMGRVVPQFLAEMDGMKGSNENILFIGATNKPKSLDPAVLRPGRFDEKIYIPLPDKQARKFLFEISLKQRPVDKDISFDQLSIDTEGYSGADIVEICNKAAIIPFRESISTGNQRSISMTDLEQAVLRISPSVNQDNLDDFTIS